MYYVPTRKYGIERSERVSNGKGGGRILSRTKVGDATIEFRFVERRTRIRILVVHRYERVGPCAERRLRSNRVRPPRFSRRHCGQLDEVGGGSGGARQFAEAVVRAARSSSRDA